jgi:hypothetical protein
VSDAALNIAAKLRLLGHIALVDLVERSDLLESGFSNLRA